MLVGVAFLPPSFLPSRTQVFYIIKRQNCVYFWNRVYLSFVCKHSQCTLKIEQLTWNLSTSSSQVKNATTTAATTFSSFHFFRTKRELLPTVNAYKGKKCNVFEQIIVYLPNILWKSATPQSSHLCSKLRNDSFTVN